MQWEVEVNVKDVMARTIGTAAPSDSVAHVARLMQLEDCGFIPVVEGGQAVGVVTDRDIVVRGIAVSPEDVGSRGINEVMSSPVVFVDEDAALEEAAEMMASHQIRRLAVTQGERLVGVLSYGNLEQALHGQGDAARDATLGVTAGA
jgi:predicted transcriptional regulator